MIFKEENIIFPSFIDNSLNYAYDKVKKNSKATFVAIKSDSGKAYLAMKDFKTDIKKLDAPYEELTPQSLRERLKTLDNCRIKLSPNPVSDVLNIEVNITFNLLQVVNQSGQVVLQEKKNDSVIAQLNISQLNNAIYFLRVFEGSVLRGVEKFMVSH